jgi:hypothetical protein
MGAGSVLELTASRHHHAPTLDQEVQALGQPVAEPERRDELGLCFEHAGRWVLSAGAWRRHLGYVPTITDLTYEGPWPRFTFDTLETAHWEVAGGLLTPPVTRIRLRLGAWGSLLEIADDPRLSPAWVPRYTALAYAVAALDFFGGNLKLRPRLDVQLVGPHNDFAGFELDAYARLDGTLVAVMSQALDLELALRNMTGNRYPLPVVEPTTGGLYLDSGQNLILGLRWKLLD